MAKIVILTPALSGFGSAAKNPTTTKYRANERLNNRSPYATNIAPSTNKNTGTTQRPNEIAFKILPSLTFLHHDIKIFPTNPALLVEPFNCDVVLVDARTHLIEAKSISNLLHTTGCNAPVIIVASEGAFAAISVQWNFDDILIDIATPAEVDGRIRVAIEKFKNRFTSSSNNQIRNGELSIDESTYTARINGVPVDLTYKEFELLKYLAQHPGRVFTRSQLLQDIWGYDYFGGTRTVDVHVRRLRSKLGPEHESLIGTVRNVGYRFTTPDSKDGFASEDYSLLSNPLKDFSF